MASVVARKLRKNPTDAEKRLWERLRYKQLEGHRFRRQVPIGRYAVDFFCPEAKLIVEVDGGQHALQSVEDEIRTAWLEQAGYQVIRYWNNEVMENIDGVLANILDELERENLL